MRVALAVAAKELRQRFRDRSAIFMAFVAPTLLAAIVTGAFGQGFGPTGSALQMRVLVADDDHSPISKAFSGVLGSKQLSRFVHRDIAKSDAELRNTINASKAGAGFIVPKGFQGAVAGGRAAQITVVARADEAIFRDIA